MMKRISFLLGFGLLLSLVDLQAQVQTLGLDSCLAMAMRNHADVQNAELKKKAARQTRYAALTKYFPQIAGLAAGFYAADPLLQYGINDIPNSGIRDLAWNAYNQLLAPLGIPSSIGLFEKGMVAGLGAVQPIFMGGRIVIGNRMAKLGETAADLQSKLSQQEVALKTEELYWQVHGLQSKQATVRDALTLLDSLYKDASAAVEAGLITRNNLLKVRLKQNEMRSNQQQLEDGLQLAGRALCQQIGIAYPDTLLLTDSLFTEDPYLYQTEVLTAVAGRDESKLLDASVKAEQLKRRMTLGEALPQIGIGGTYYYGGVTEEYRSNLVGFAAVQLPISAWWETGHKLKKHQLEIQQAENTRRDLTEKMALQTRQAWMELSTSYRQIELDEIAVEDAKENLQLTQDYFQAGLETLSDVLEAQTLYQQALDKVVDSRIAYRMKLIQYKQITGR